MIAFTPFTALTLVAVMLAGHRGRHTVRTADDILTRSRAAYAALTSYADSGTVVDEYTGFIDRAAFRTLIVRSPRNLLIDFRAVASEYKSGMRLPLNTRGVLWMENGELQTWYSKDQAHETYPADGGQQVNALKNAGYSTRGISTVVPSLFYAKAGLVSPVLATEEATTDGLEMVEGRRCHRIHGVERYRYPSGQETGVRAITIWIDAETFLIHKVFQDTPKGFPRNEISRRTTIIRYRINPKVEAAQFHFAVPTS